MKFIGCRIYLDGIYWDCTGFETRMKNLWGAWMKLQIDYGFEYVPKSRDEFLRRGGKVSWFRPY